MLMSPTVSPAQASSSAQPERRDFPSDPLLDSGSFIYYATRGGAETLASGAHRPPEPPAPDGVHRTRNDSDPSTAASGNGSPADSRSRRRSAVTESWLPPGWIVEDRIRTSGATAGAIDKYYFDPASGRRFRSKIGVLYYLEHGTLPPKRQKKTEGSDSHSDASEGTPASKKKKPIPKPRDPDFDYLNPPEKVSWVLNESSEDSWTPFIGDVEISESVNREWATAFTVATTRKSGLSEF